MRRAVWTAVLMSACGGGGEPRERLHDYAAALITTSGAAMTVSRCGHDAETGEGWCELAGSRPEIDRFVRAFPLSPMSRRAMVRDLVRPDRGDDRCLPAGSGTTTHEVYTPDAGFPDNDLGVTLGRVVQQRDGACLTLSVR